VPGAGMPGPPADDVSAINYFCLCPHLYAPLLHVLYLTIEE
jgi:hypothetical protein